ncbi:MAG: NUDIX domain-containing protein [Acutalibacteraceae bacterium]|nr:NUDIX domain-containing protein [Acutalibacteraceae bacterium]
MSSEKTFLENYNIESYDRPSVATDIVVFTMRSENTESFRKDPVSKLSVLLIERGEHPFKGMWALPGGFVKMDETVEEAALREVIEETNVKPTTLVYTGVFSAINRDPRGRIISNAFTCIFSQEPKAIAGTDAKNTKWFDISLQEQQQGKYILELTSDEMKLYIQINETKSPLGMNQYEVENNDVLAFDHAKIILTSLKALKRRATNFELIFDFLPFEFTLASLQKVQETITGISTVPANFRRKVCEYVEETGNFTQGAGHRPAMLYRKKVSV